MGTSHGSPPPGTCHTDLSVENQNGEEKVNHSIKIKENLPDSKPNPETKRWVGANRQQKTAKATQSEPRGHTSAAVAQKRMR